MPHRIADFLFTGAGIVPLVALAAGEPLFGALSCFALILAGGVAGIADPEAPHRTAAGAEDPARRD